MIPYQELCDALASWRTRNGLANGPSAKVRFTPAATVVSAPADAFYAADELAPVEPASPAPVAPPAAVTPVTFDGSIDEMLADDELDAPTSLHLTPEAVKKDETGEIDLDSAVVDEDDL